MRRWTNVIGFLLFLVLAVNQAWFNESNLTHLTAAFIYYCITMVYFVRLIKEVMRHERSTIQVHE